MKKYLILLITLIFISSRAYALNIVYPKKNPTIINSASTFFIGSVNPGEELSINNVPVQVASNGSFAWKVPLNFGINIFNFIIKSSTVNTVENNNDNIQQPLFAQNAEASIQTYSFQIERPQPQLNIDNNNQADTDYDTPLYFTVTKDLTPLRATPQNCGINRLSHLPLGTNLIITGEKNNFYKVFLNNAITAFVAKSDVTNSSDYFTQAQIKDFKITDDKDFIYYEVELTKKVPFSTNDSNTLITKLYNLENTKDSYEINVPIQKLFGYDTYYDNNKFVLKVRKPLKINNESPLKNIKITIDAGHGGTETGATGCQGEKEKDINLAIAKNLEQELSSRGANIVMTRSGDYTVSLQDRVKKAKDTNSTLSVSIHANALPDGGDPLKCRGTSIYYYYNQAKPLADSIISSMTSQLGTQNDKVRQQSLALVRSTSSVSILIEVAYMINPEDDALLNNTDFQKNCSKAIADGIENYLRK